MIRCFGRLFAIMRKEIQQLSRDRLTFGMIIGIPMLQIILFGFAINTDIRHLHAAVADAAQTRRSLASAITAPAPAARPFTAAITGLSSRRHALTTSPVMRANSSTPFMSRCRSSPMISWTSPPLLTTCGN